MSDSIPEDLREEYTELKFCAPRDGINHYMRRCEELIERIATLTAAKQDVERENERLRSELKEARGHLAQYAKRPAWGYDSDSDVTNAREAIDRALEAK